jgi:hypothetical protein
VPASLGPENLVQLDSESLSSPRPRRLDVVSLHPPSTPDLTASRGFYRCARRTRSSSQRRPATRRHVLLCRPSFPRLHRICPTCDALHAAALSHSHPWLRTERILGALSLEYETTERPGETRTMTLREAVGSSLPWTTLSILHRRSAPRPSGRRLPELRR